MSKLDANNGFKIQILQSESDSCFDLIIANTIYRINARVHWWESNPTTIEVDPFLFIEVVCKGYMKKVEMCNGYFCS